MNRITMLTARAMPLVERSNPCSRPDQARVMLTVDRLRAAPFQDVVRCRKCAPPLSVSSCWRCTASWIAAQDRGKFRVSTRLVQVTVIVHDTVGRPVGGLTADDFRLYDGGQEQRIELFSAESDSITAPQPTQPVPVKSAAVVHEFSNHIPAPGGATVILFDRLNTPATAQIYARRHLVNFLRQIRSDGRVGIYVLDANSIRVLHDFTNDARSLVRAVTRYHAMTSNAIVADDNPLPEATESGDAALDAELAAFLERASENMTEHFRGVRATATIAAFASIANHVAAVEGRKNLVWITAGFPLEALTVGGTSMTTAIQGATWPLNDANVTLYAVDARGLIGAITWGPRGKPVFTTLSSVHTNLDILQVVANETGGRAFYSSNDINSSLRRAVDDSRMTYTLGYYPAHGKWDGTYRQIKVKLKRPGVEVRHRKGYLAIAGPDRVTAAGAVRSALLSPLEATGIKLTARVERVAGTTSDVKVVVTTGPGTVAFERGRALGGDSRRRDCTEARRRVRTEEPGAHTEPQLRA